MEQVWKQVSFGAGVPVLVQLEAEGEAASGGAGAEPECPRTCGGKGTKSTPRATQTVSFSRLGGV